MATATKEQDGNSTATDDDTGLSTPILGVKNQNLRDIDLLRGFVQNPETISLRTYNIMARTDETISAALEFTKLSVMSKLGEYCHENEEIQEFVRANFSRMRGTLRGVVGEMVKNAMSFGCSVAEIIWQPAATFATKVQGKRGEEPRAITFANKVTLQGLATLLPRSIDFQIDLTKGPNRGEVANVVQWRGGQFEEPIAAEKCLIYSHRKENGNPWGNSRLQCVYKNWWLKDILLRAMARALERYGSPILVGTTEQMDRPKKGATGELSTRGAVFLKVLEDLHDNACIVKEPDQLIELLAAAGGKSVGKDFLDALEYLDRRILRGALFPSLIFDNTDTGSRALGETHTDILALALAEVRDDVADMLIEQLVKRMVYYNYGPQDDYGSFSAPAIKPVDLERWANIIEKLTGCRVLSADYLEDLNMMREIFGAEQVDEVFEKPEPPMMIPGGTGFDEDGEPIDPTAANGKPPQNPQKAAGATAKDKAKAKGGARLSAAEALFQRELMAYIEAGLRAA